MMKRIDNQTYLVLQFRKSNQVQVLVVWKRKMNSACSTLKIMIKIERVSFWLQDRVVYFTMNRFLATVDWCDFRGKRPEV